jgi:2-isopropylmalate synthase
VHRQRYGERAGNADLFAVVGNLVTKLGMPVLPHGALAELTRTSHALAEIANLAPDTHQAYVGAAAFAHKAGLHASAIKVDPELYNHMNPVDVGNGQRVLVTEMAGRASVELKGAELGLDLAGRPDAVSAVVGTVKEREAQGWSFEAADASLELLMRLALGEAELTFAVESYRVLIENRGGEVVSEATVKLVVDGERSIAVREGNGPVNALDAALRAALTPSRPWLADVELSDFKVRLLAREGTARGTDAVTRVLVASTDGDGSWTTVGVHGNVVEASWLALVDAVAYAGLRAGDGALSGAATG